ncbi:chromosome 9 open reading frame 172 [Nesidiocoris tenuis]|uniref:Chromosome 9 open reading frame 172 n=1 Tax=Nesidiocoris tenuis TaxID=355587 RepID=A0ABN7BCC0_9HEMI|nr:chromosome 9 open reading frame 172 [Nesidiocoris tenuis]
MGISCYREVKSAAGEKAILRKILSLLHANLLWEPKAVVGIKPSKNWRVLQAKEEFTQIAWEVIPPCGDADEAPGGMAVIVEPPENELQKVGERVMSEHELRVQRSLQKLNVPDWYKSSTVPPQGFLLKRHSEGGGGGGSVTSPGWQGLSSKTTSLSSLGSLQHATPRSPSNLLSPSPTPSGHTFSRWSTSRLNSNPTSTSTSPCGSARSSFNYRQPYLGWRSQERLSNPRTPAERLAAGLLTKKQQQPSVPNMNELSEVHSSIKEVTSAIVHYVSGSRADDRLSPALGRHYDNSSSRSASPRGSNSRLCWLESSFVGNKPIDVPETPVSLTATPEHAKGTADLYLELTTTHRPNNVATINDAA